MESVNGSSRAKLVLAAVQLDTIPNRITRQHRYWVPEEPLFGPDPLASALQNPTSSIAHLGDTREFEVTRRRIHLLYQEAIRIRLVHCLELCKKADVDIVVFPEYSIPPNLLEVLIGYSSEMVIVAGLGLVRPADLGQSYPSVGNVKDHSNCAVVVGPQSYVEIVTKQHPAEGELMGAGTGTRILEVYIRDRSVRLGVAICQDYIHRGHTFSPAGGAIDIVAVPALSRSMEEFTPNEPRDFVRIMANHSAYGGSAILVPGLHGPSFINTHGTTPIPPGEEAIVIVEYDRYQEKPTSTYSTGNRLLRRATLVAAPSEFEQRVIEAARTLPIELGTSNETIDTLDLWITSTKGQSRVGGLHESLKTYRRLSMSARLSDGDRVLLTTHLGIPNAPSTHETRIAQATLVIDALRRLTDIDSPAQFYTAQGNYAELLQHLKPPRKHDASLKERPSTSRQTHAAFGLGQFRTGDALRTIPYQLDLLRSFSMTYSSDTTLCYRLTTVENAITGDKDPRFEIIIGAGQSTDDARQDLEPFVRSCRAVLVSAWACYTSGAKVDMPGDCAYLICPEAEGTHPPPMIREDWGAIVDVLRAQPHPISVEVSVNPLAVGEDASASTSGFPSRPDRAEASADTSNSAAFLRTQQRESAGDKPSITLRIAISSSHEVSIGLLNTVGSMLLGHKRFAVVTVATHGGDTFVPVDYPGFALRPDEALRVLHPPHGHIEGRGLGARAPLRLLARDIPLTQAGCTIGRAVAARPHVDMPFDVAIDAESRLRHVYIIGKTGSGKTNLLKNMIRQDIESGSGLAVVDPHGDLAEYVLGHCGSRADDTVYLDFADPHNLPVINPFSLDIRTDDDHLLAVEETLEILGRRSFHEFHGPRFEDTMRLALDTLHLGSPGEPPSLLDVSAVFRDRTSRFALVKGVSSDSDIHQRWQTFDSMRETEQAEIASWALAKLAELEQSPVLRHTLAHRQSTLSISDIISSGKILIARVPELSIGASAASFIGTLLVSRISRQIVEGADTGHSKWPILSLRG